MAEVISHGLCDRRCTQRVADAPAGHGIGLGDAVDEDGVLLDLLAKRRNACECSTVIDELIVNLVRDDVQIVLDADVRDCLERFLRIDSTGRIRGVIEDDGLGLVRDGRLELLRRELETLLLADVNNDRYAAKQTHHFIVADPVRGRHDHLIARVNQRSQRDIDHVLCTAGDDRLRRLILQTVIRLHAVANRLTQLNHTGCGRISRFSVADRAHTRIADAVGCGKIGLAGAKADNVLPFCFHLLRQCADSQRRGRAHSCGNFGQWLHRHPSFS